MGNAGQGEAKHSLPVYAQSWTRVVKRLGSVLDGFQVAEGEVDTTTIIQSLQIAGRLYDVFETFVPNIKDWLPEHEFNGYATPEDWRQNRYDEGKDNAPTFPQFIEAFDVIVDVNGGKRFMAMLGKVFPPTWVQTKLAEMVEDYQDSQRARSDGLPNSLTTSTESPQSSSTTTVPTEAQPASSSEIEHLDFAPRREWMPESSGSPQNASA